MAGISIWQLLIILAIVLLLFGAKRIRTLGSDVGTSIKGFRDAMREGGKSDSSNSEDAADSSSTSQNSRSDTIIDGDPVKERDKI